jgi:hypothetical protein
MEISTWKIIRIHRHLEIKSNVLDFHSSTN